MRVEVSYYINDYNTAEGRLLGYIDSKQFAAIKAHPKKLARKVASGRTVKLEDVLNCENKRLVFSILDLKGRPKLLITSEIGTVDDEKYLKGKLIELALTDKNYGWLAICPI